MGQLESMPLSDTTHQIHDSLNTLCFSNRRLLHPQILGGFIAHVAVHKSEKVLAIK